MLISSHLRIVILSIEFPHLTSSIKIHKTRYTNLSSMYVSMKSCRREGSGFVFYGVARGPGTGLSDRVRKVKATPNGVSRGVKAVPRRGALAANGHRRLAV